MPTLALVNALVERSMNAALNADPNSTERLKAVQGKTFRLQLSELPWPLTLHFCADKVMLMGQSYDAIDGALTTDLSTLPMLTDASKVTAALQRGDLALEGDPIFAQQASQVFLALQIDWEELLAGKFGDVPGYWLAQGWQSLRRSVPEVSQGRKWLSETLTEEKKVAVGQLEYALFSDELRALEKRVRQLEARKV